MANAPTAIMSTGVPKPDNFEVWLGERNKWLQSAARLMLDKKAVPNEAELDQLTNQCIAEAGGPVAAAFSTVIPGSIVQTGVRPSVFIRSMDNVRGVNRIKDQTNLSFGKGNLVAIYGANGSGKTGYSRILKQACGCRLREEIYPNVFEKGSPSPEVTFSIEIDRKTETVVWTQKGGAVGQLTHVDVFDTRVASNYVTVKNAARYEPSRMRFVSSLISTCTLVANRLNDRKTALVSSLPQIPTQYNSTVGAKWLTKLSAETSTEMIETGCAYTAEDNAERVAGESALAQKDGVARLQAIPAERNRINQVSTAMTALSLAYADEKMTALINARTAAVTKRQAATDAGKALFSSAPLPGVGHASWMLLWEKARQYSTAHAYPEISFPNPDESALCVLCQQPLGQEGQSRLSHFEAFVKGGLEAEAKAAEKNLDTLITALPSVPAAKDWDLQVAALKLAPDSAVEVYASLSSRAKAVMQADKVTDLPVVNWGPITAAHTNVMGLLATEEKNLNDLQIESKRKEIETRVLALSAAQWLNQNKASITTEVTRLKSLALMDKAITLCSTNQLTRKHTELASQDLDKAYQERFREELKLLGGSYLPILPIGEQKGRGNMTFGLTLQGAQQAVPAEKVLSEGEARVVALAAFLADISGLDHGSPFIFDDPISSLDQDYEERVVQRLVSLAKSRQVIVFTHRLSLLTLLESEVKRLKDMTDGSGKPAPVNMHIETVTSLGKFAGISQGTAFRDMKPKKGVNTLLSELPALRKMWDAGDTSGYDSRIGAICTNIRILTEKCVETVLLNEVLIRFRRSVQTQGRIASLAKINQKDCTFIEDLMTRYSVFEHSQPAELPAKRPDIGEVEADVASVAAWLDEFDKRSVA